MNTPLGQSGMRAPPSKSSNTPVAKLLSISSSTADATHGQTLGRCRKHFGLGLNGHGVVGGRIHQARGRDVHTKRRQFASQRLPHLRDRTIDGGQACRCMHGHARGGTGQQHNGAVLAQHWQRGLQALPVPEQLDVQRVAQRWHGHLRERTPRGATTHGQHQVIRAGRCDP
jgi:hypothetical protein